MIDLVDDLCFGYVSLHFVYEIPTHAAAYSKESMGTIIHFPEHFFLTV